MVHVYTRVHSIRYFKVPILWLHVEAAYLKSLGCFEKIAIYFVIEKFHLDGLISC